MTYLDGGDDGYGYGYGSTIYPPRPPAPLPRRRGLLPALGFKSARDREIEQQRWQYYGQQMQVYQNKMLRDQDRERDRLAKEQDRMEREHRSEQVKLAEQQAKLQEAITKAQHAQARLDQLQGERQRFLAQTPKTAPALGHLQRGLDKAKTEKAEATHELERLAKQMEPLAAKLRAPRPPDAPPISVAGINVPFTGGATAAQKDYDQAASAFKDLYWGAGKGEPGVKTRPGFPSTYARYEQGQEAPARAQESLSEEQQAIQRRQEDANRRVLDPIQTQELAAQKELEDARAQQQAAQTILGAYQKGGPAPSQEPAPQPQVQGGNAQGGHNGIPPTPFYGRPQGQFQAPQQGMNTGGKGAIPIPIIGPILSSLGSALAGGKHGGGSMAPQMPRMGAMGGPMPPPRPQFAPQMQQAPMQQAASPVQQAAAPTTPMAPMPAASHPPLFTQMPGAGTVAGPARTLVDQIVAGAQKYGVDPRLALGLAASEGGPGLLQGAAWHPHNDPSYSGHPGISYGPFQLRNPGLGTEFLRRYGALPNPSNVQQQIDFVMPYLARGEFKPWSAFKDRGGPQNIAAIGAKYLPGKGTPGTQVADAPPAAGPATSPLPEPPAAPAPQQKQVNPVAAGLSAIKPAQPTVQLSQPSGELPQPAIAPAQPVSPLPFPGDTKNPLDHAAQAALLAGLSKQDVIAKMKQHFPNDQIPGWLTQEKPQEEEK